MELEDGFTTIYRPGTATIPSSDIDARGPPTAAQAVVFSEESCSDLPNSSYAVPWHSRPGRKKKATRCYNCVLRGHNWRACPHPPPFHPHSTCGNCGSHGHDYRACPEHYDGPPGAHHFPGRYLPAAKTEESGAAGQGPTRSNGCVQQDQADDRQFDRHDRNVLDSTVVQGAAGQPLPPACCDVRHGDPPACEAQPGPHQPAPAHNHVPDGGGDHGEHPERIQHVVYPRHGGDQFDLRYGYHHWFLYTAYCTSMQVVAHGVRFMWGLGFLLDALVASLFVTIAFNRDAVGGGVTALPFVFIMVVHYWIGYPRWIKPWLDIRFELASKPRLILRLVCAIATLICAVPGLDVLAWLIHWASPTFRYRDVNPARFTEAISIQYEVDVELLSYAYSVTMRRTRSTAEMRTLILDCNAWVRRHRDWTARRTTDQVSKAVDISYTTNPYLLKRISLFAHDDVAKAIGVSHRFLADGVVGGTQVLPP